MLNVPPRQELPWRAGHRVHIPMPLEHMEMWPLLLLLRGGCRVMQLVLHTQLALMLLLLEDKTTAAADTAAIDFDYY